MLQTERRFSFRPVPVSTERWRAENLGGVVNGIGLRERAELSADGDVFWAYGDGRHASGPAVGRVAVFGALIRVNHQRMAPPDVVRPASQPLEPI